MCTCSNQLQPHDPVPGVCRTNWHRWDCPDIWGYGCNCGGNEPIPCDDCHRTDGTHDLEVEH